MYKFPNDPTICEKWVEFCKSDQINDMLVLEGIDKLRSSSFAVCSDHFEKWCFINPHNRPQGIHKGSVPTIIAGHPVLVSSFKKANQIPDSVNLDVQHRVPEPCGEEMLIEVIEVLHEELEESTAEPPITANGTQTAPIAEVQPIVGPNVFACQCTEEYEYRPMFFEERSRAIGLVKEIKATKSKLQAIKQPARQKSRAISRINESIRKIKDKIRALAQEHHTVVDLSSDNDSDI